MNKQELITRMAAKAGLSRKDTEKALNAFLIVVEEALVRGDTVRLTGFGIFETRRRKARTGRNPHEPEKTFEVPASKAPVFKPGKQLKDAVNK